MIEGLIQYVTDHAKHAPWVVFLSALLAGLNIPISIDILLAFSALLAATTVPHLALPLYFSLLFGCIFSAWIAYWIGRLLGDKLSSVPLFKKPLSEENKNRLSHFYNRYGVWTSIVGRFIPFGVRNCIFMSSGMSRYSFKRFALRDALACFLWATLLFPLFYSIGLNLDQVGGLVKRFNILIFSLFSVAGIGILWYKKKKKQRDE
ncbi:MAG: DedA family protein [Simkaniaceae bacterium]